MKMKYASLLLAGFAFTLTSTAHASDTPAPAGDMTAVASDKPMQARKATAAPSDVSLGIGVKGMSTNWMGENDTSGTDFSQRNGQLAFNIVYQRNKMFIGANIQGGTFEFKNGSPDQISETGTTTAGGSEEKIKHTEVDLVFGYNVFRYFSLFADVKVITNEWVDQDPDPEYKMEASGLGICVSGFIPAGKNFTFYGTAGFVPLTVKTEDEEIGDGLATAVDIGGAISLGSRNRVRFGFKTQRQAYEFDNGDEQSHRLNSFYLGYSHHLWIR